MSNDWWLNGGWSGFAAGIDLGDYFRASCAGVPIPTLVQLKSGPPQPDTPQGTPETFAGYAAYADSMIEYLHVTHGKGKFWELMLAYKDESSAAVNFQKVLNVTPERFYAEWTAWAKKKYC